MLTADLVGQTDTDPTHWRPSDAELPEQFSIRLFSSDFAVVDGFPVTMNGCDRRQLRVKWRSLSQPVVAAYTDYLDPGWEIDVLGAADPAVDGDLIVNGCQQPVFATTSDSILVDIVIAVEVWYPAVG